MTAWAEEPGGYREIMGIAHREFPLFGVQFHPESFLTHSGTTSCGRFLRRKKFCHRGHRGHRETAIQGPMLISIADTLISLLNHPSPCTLCPLWLNTMLSVEEALKLVARHCAAACAAALAAG